jgi:hypothetical protein
VSKTDAATYRKAVVGRLDIEVEGWREMGNAALAKRLEAMGVRTAKGLRHDAETVRDFRRTLERKVAEVAAKAVAVEQSHTDDIDQMRGMMLRILGDLSGAPSAARFQEIDDQIAWIGLRLCEDQLEGNETLQRGLTLVERKRAAPM